MIVALLGLVISLFAYLIAFPQPHQRRFDIYIALFAFHLIATLAYWTLSFESAMDAFTYYRDPYNFIDKNPFEQGTYFVVHMTQFIRNTLGGSFLDHFLFFQCFGMIAMALLLRIFWEVAESLDITVPPAAYFLLFLPGLHFWSVAIGKDGLMMMGVVLSAWSVMKLPKRAIWFAVALAIMVVIRPHVAAIAMVGLAASLALGKQLKLPVKIALAPVALVGFAFVAGKVYEQFNVQDLESFSRVIDYQQGLGEEYGGGADLESLPYPLKLFSLLFRPMFVDAEGVPELAASGENVVLLFVFGYLLYHWKVVFRLMRNVGFVVYGVTYSTILILLLAAVNYNIGLGQRQKMMAVPVVIVLWATVYMYRRHLARVAADADARSVAASLGEPAAHTG